MELIEFRKNYDQQIQPQPGLAPIGPTAAWKVFVEQLNHHPAGSAFESISLSFGLAERKENDAQLVQIYFGRLIDAVNNLDWKTIEINFYYYYPLTENFKQLLGGQLSLDAEINFSDLTDSVKNQEKITGLLAFAKDHEAFFAEAERSTLSTSDYAFWVW